MKDYTQKQIERIAWEREKSKDRLIRANMKDWIKENADEIVWIESGSFRAGKSSWRKRWKSESLARAKSESSKILIDRLGGFWEDGRVWINIP